LFFYCQKLVDTKENKVIIASQGKQENTENAQTGKAKQAAEMLVNIWSRS